MNPTPTEPMRNLLVAATRAPSSHNTQPWTFHCDGNRIELHADRTRGLPVNDPLDRELTISCGAALFNLEAAAAAAGLTSTVQLMPVGDDVDLLAVITLGSGRRRDDVPGDAELAHAIARRRTHRGSFRDIAVPDAVIVDLDAALAQHAVTLRWVPPGPERENVAELVRQGDRAQFADPTWRHELASWMRSRRHGDGLTVPTLTGAVTRLIVSDVDLGHRTGTKDAELTTRAPLVLALATIGDQPEDWLVTGRALQHLLLKAASAGVQAGYANQPCQVARLRPALRRTLALQGHPQLLLRLGFPQHATPTTPRRPIQDTADTTPDGPSTRPCR